MDEVFVKIYLIWIVEFFVVLVVIFLGIVFGVVNK